MKLLLVSCVSEGKCLKYHPQCSARLLSPKLHLLMGKETGYSSVWLQEGCGPIPWNLLTVRYLLSGVVLEKHHSKAWLHYSVLILKFAGVFSKEISVNVEMNELFMALGTKQKASDSTNSNVRYRNHVDTKSKTMKDFESQLEGLKIS